MIKKVLIANRGEIAVRIIRACKESGIRTVAIFSDADVTSLHVRMAEEAYHVGPAPSAESYLYIGRIIDVAKKSGTDAIHPGYGFLAENPVFAKEVKAAGVIFIGPEADTIELLGDKMAARKRMIDAGVPVVPGSETKVDDIESASRFAGEIGYPVLIKAAAGGGGKGMRIVRKSEEMTAALRMAQNEARSAFGDERIYIEKYLERPRHIEIQIMADTHGNVVHLGERECSIQRRHQKVIEETPSPVVDDELRQRMGETAVRAAKASNYVNAGTVEFLLDQQKNFYFLEVNTRLQVEHPVTELVTGIDLAKEQIRVANGEKLSFTQESIRWNGAALECRIYAEDPDSEFMPSIGKITEYREPSGPGVRVDSGLDHFGQVSIYYDPLISKLCTWGNDRDEAISRMRRALAEYRIQGVKTVIPFHLLVMNHEKFIAGDLSTHFIGEELAQMQEQNPMAEDTMKKIAIFCAMVEQQHQNQVQNIHSDRNDKVKSAWKMKGRQRIA
ncbi:acetyl-CoA carboxylase biotin carboxylase subunit [candidate division KSB1 bacterium]|nr:acetyl-CoA carboxylase biotin carboxylase subunit [candidate division KSB1 bacterium]